jgi:hypothetical protein
MASLDLPPRRWHEQSRMVTRRLAKVPKKSTIEQNCHDPVAKK